MAAIVEFAFCILIGTVGVLTGISLLRKRVRINNWPTTNGSVLERGTFQPSVGPRTPAFRHSPLVKYAYRVGDRDFVNDWIRPRQLQQPSCGTIDWAQKKADSFADVVSVHYNPDDPGESYLLQTSKAMLCLVVIASFFVILFGLFLLVVK